jgi:hypothetical protein
LICGHPCAGANCQHTYVCFLPHAPARPSCIRQVFCSCSAVCARPQACHARDRGSGARWRCFSDGGVCRARQGGGPLAVYRRQARTFCVSRRDHEHPHHVSLNAQRFLLPRAASMTDFPHSSHTVSNLRRLTLLNRRFCEYTRCASANGRWSPMTD